MENYIRQIKELINPSFSEIRGIANKEISRYNSATRNTFWKQLNRGEALLNTHEQLCQYLYSFGKMHQAKLHDAFQNLPEAAYSNGYEIVDWGCGQGLGTINLFDFVKSRGIENKVKRITLIEPSKMALDRAVLHIKAFIDEEIIDLQSQDQYFENLDVNAIKSKLGLPVIHIFSNILDLSAIDLKHLANLVDSAVVSDNYVVSVGPLNPTNRRIDAFYNYFNAPLIYSQEDSWFRNTNWTYKCKLFKLEATIASHLIPISYYPSVQFHAAYELDAYRLARKSERNTFFDTFSKFEIAAPFDIGASVYDDVHPILAVLNNIITRGLPTKASLLIEEVFSIAFQNTFATNVLGEILYESKGKLNFGSIADPVKTKLLTQGESVTINPNHLQELLSPIAIARFQKIIIEAIITGHISLESIEWDILVEEKDVPFAALALKDFSEMFNSLTQLSDDYQDLKFPKVNIDIIGSKEFQNSPLHLNANVKYEPQAIHFSKTYDFVVDMAMLETSDITKESFSKYKCKNNCYFNIRSTTKNNSTRNIYTSSLIKYQNVVDKTIQGNYTVIEHSKEHLKYFLKLLFRKDDFRPGQLPILNRALQNRPVIGLLPTGGGKSLTYQLSALLQPGITLVIDPLRSLMKDQYDGLINNGIDFCTYINSSINSADKKVRETQMESSQLLFVFVSPERLSILNFRERLKAMHEYNVYFSYGVIDEVHCVSEWGHDFRFSYLHLGRNLYKYVRAKENAVSLFGLTATASFDVLADVERELSGNGAFELDADTTVRYENTNRLELQYKVEKVDVTFDLDTSFDTGGRIDSSLPRAIKIGDNRPIQNSKSDFLKNYVSKIPNYINELQSEENILVIKSNFNARQNLEENFDHDLNISISREFLAQKLEYQEAGIIFCPHKNNTGLSVVSNRDKLLGLCSDVGSFIGGDDDDNSMSNLEKFRNNKLPLMVATKAFGMGIDKPNVRFTVNMNYSSSLESFVQEAGRAGRDRKMALSTILFADYELAKIKANCPIPTFPIDTLKNKWFKKADLQKILDFYHIVVQDEYIETASPSKDLVKFHCSKNPVMFINGHCSTDCEAFKSCNLKLVPPKYKVWYSENELTQIIKNLNLPLNRKNFRYLSADYETVMYFFNESFKGDTVEKRFMHNLLSMSEVYIEQASNSAFGESLKIERISKNGFLESLIDAKNNSEVIVYVPYTNQNSTDISKAIYRMCCIELIEDFTQDYVNKQFRIIVHKKEEGEYYVGLFNFLLRYYTKERAGVEILKAKSYPINALDQDPLIIEIHRCLAYLTEFVYDKISEKRKRAIDDMRNFCLEGIDESKPWIERNESLKDYIYYYFNSKYAKSDFVAENGEPFSLTEDTDYGKESSPEIVYKYLRIIEDEMVGIGTEIDNVKHLQGAVRLIKRSLTDNNPSLALLNSFTLLFLGTKNNPNLEQELWNDYNAGMLEMAERMGFDFPFWNFFKHYNKKLKEFGDPETNQIRVSEMKLAIHAKRLNQITELYIQ
jgi:superfamily II DNA helicase RecQ